MTQRPVATLQVYRVAVPLTSPYRLSFGTLHAFDTFYAVLEGQGRIGAGEVTPLPGYGDETPAAIEEDLKRMAREGRDLSVPEMARDIHPRSPFLASGLICAAETWREGREAAFSRPLGRPVPVAALCAEESPEKMGDAVGRLLREGYRALKVKVGGRPVEVDVERVKAIAGAMAEGVELRLDANQGFDRETALAFCRRIDSLPITLLEQPLPRGWWDGHKALAESTAIPIMLDESIYSEGDIERAKACGAAFVKLKLCKHPGIEETQKLVRAARKHGLGVVLGNGVQTALGNHLENRIHVAAGLERAAESTGFQKVMDGPIHHRMKVRDGWLVDQGIEIDSDTFSRYAPVVRIPVRL